MSAVRQLPEGSREESFVSSVIQRCRHDKGLAARLRRADNPATEYQSWEFLAAHNVDLEQERQRLPFVTVAAAIAKGKVEVNGALGLGAALAASYEGGNTNAQAKARLRRILACQDIDELCRILRPVLALIRSRVRQPLDYARLLRQLRHFALAVQQSDGRWQQRIKAGWAQEFYRREADGEEAA